jgi:hypothetical protein
VILFGQPNSSMFEGLQMLKTGFKGQIESTLIVLTCSVGEEAGLDQLQCVEEVNLHANSGSCSTNAMWLRHPRSQNRRAWVYWPPLRNGTSTHPATCRWTRPRARMCSRKSHSTQDPWITLSRRWLSRSSIGHLTSSSSSLVAERTNTH